MLNAGDTSSAGAGSAVSISAGRSEALVSISAGCSEALGGSVLVAAGTGAVDGGDVILRGVLDAVKQEQADGSHFSMAMARDESQWTAKVVWTHRVLQGNT